VHIPDGYISPIISLGMAAVTVPTWAVATRKVQSVLNNRTIPLLAIFSALSFTIMMFNVPVPGGTTAHGVGATLIAVVLGPWAAVIAVSVALVIQSLFFGDGGVLAIFVNVFNMAIVMPFVGYWVYRLLAGRAPLLDSRRAWAAGIAAYVAITVSAIFVGIELGIQPILFTQDGHALYSPYGLSETIPAMILAHALGASIVEGVITFLGVSFLQRRQPDLLLGLSSTFGTGQTSAGMAGGRPLWQVIAATVAGTLAVLAAVGLVLGGGDPGHLFGSDWSRVDWPAVGSMLLVVGLIFVVLVPLAYLILPKAWKRPGAALVALAVVAPLGLIAPGFAYGEGTAEDVKAAFGYIPQGISDLSSAFSAPLAGYEIPLPWFHGANAQLWHAAIGYEITGIIGMLICGALVLGIASLVRGRRTDPAEPADPAPRAASQA
jgi:cobalt/nickel transport system permease protein